jgi:HEAT repeat protein
MMEFKQADIETALRKLDGSGSDAEWAAVEVLRHVAGEQLPELLLKKYRTARKAGERASCVYHSMRYSRTNAVAVQFGREALNDPAQAVRYRACMLLAYSQDEASLEDLRAALSKAPTNSQEDVAAAIDAIVSRNHNYFVDRDHSGKTTMNVR